MDGQEIDFIENVLLCTFAAGEGHFAVLQWLYSLGCPIDIAECIAKVEDSIKWRQEQKWNLPKESYEEVLDWLLTLEEDEYE
jgi:hypothetical protein